MNQTVYELFEIRLDKSLIELNLISKWAKFELNLSFIIFSLIRFVSLTRF